MRKFVFIFSLLFSSQLTIAQDSLAVWENVFIPNLFSPNNDGENDAFKVYGRGFLSLELRIYDRWAELVYQSTDLNEITEVGWDGTTGNKEQPAGSYLWVIAGFFESGKKVTIEGKNNGTLILYK